MLRPWKCDLHIHTGLSPCADTGMSPLAIIREAREKGMDAIGITDHNSAENAVLVEKAGRELGVSVVVGMEVTSGEEVHILALFDRDSDLASLQELVYGNLDGENDEAVFGPQVVFDEDDAVVGCNHRLLIGATNVPLGVIVDRVHSLGGLAIASHVDRNSFSIRSQLGFIPGDLCLDALEMSACGSWEELDRGFRDTARDLAVIRSSDAHRLEDIGRVSTSFLMEDASISEMKQALAGRNGRAVTV